MRPETEPRTSTSGAKQIPIRSGAIRTIPDKGWIGERHKPALHDTCLSLLTLPDCMGELSDFSMFSLFKYMYNKGHCGKGWRIKAK